MRIMTFNLRTDFILDINNRWRNRAPIVYSLISNLNCDIIGVQELNIKMYKDLSENLKEYNIVGSERSKRLFIEKNDILVHKNHEILEHNTFWLSKYPDKKGSSNWCSIYPRICTTAVVRLESGEIVRIYNTHLDFLLPKARQLELKNIRAYMEAQYEKEKLPVILMGDFNASPSSKLIKSFTSIEGDKRRLVAVQEVNKRMYEATTMGKFKGKKRGSHIDYIFVSEDFIIKDAEIIDFNKGGKYPSDHYPVLSTVVLNNC